MRRIPQPQQQAQFQQSPFIVTGQSPFPAQLRPQQQSSSLVPVRSPQNSIMPAQMQMSHMMNPFQHIQQMMAGFGGLQEDPMVMGMMMMALGGDPFEDMFSFSDIHKNVHSRGIEGSYVSQSFMSSAVMGPDGQIFRENYYQNNMGEHRGGQTISQKQQAYRNTDGLNRIAEERMLNDRGRKIVREKRGNDIQETMHYYNIDEEEATVFDNDWRRADKNMKFLQNHQKYLQMPEQSMTIQSQPTLSIGYQGQPTQMAIGQQPITGARSNVQFSQVPQRPAVSAGSYSTSTRAVMSPQTSNVRFNSGGEVRPAISGTSFGSINPNAVSQAITYQSQAPTMHVNSARMPTQPLAHSHSQVYAGNVTNNYSAYTSPISSSPLTFTNNINANFNSRSQSQGQNQNQGNIYNHINNSNTNSVDAPVNEGSNYGPVSGKVNSPISSLRSSKLSAADSINNDNNNNTNNGNNGNSHNNGNGNGYCIGIIDGNSNNTNSNSNTNNINANSQQVGDTGGYLFKKAANTTSPSLNAQPEIKEDKI